MNPLKKRQNYPPWCRQGESTVSLLHRKVLLRCTLRQTYTLGRYTKQEGKKKMRQLKLVLFVFNIAGSLLSGAKEGLALS